MDPRPGWQTTEFWITLVKQVMMILVLLKVVPQTDSENLTTAVTSAVVAVGTFVASALVVMAYVRGRTQLKQNATDAKARAQ